jgi:serine/threonine-protein kinase HipA
VIFNALVGNHDAHAKNFSLLYSGKSCLLSPSYDILSTAIYSELTQKMAMKIGSQYKFSEVHARHWEQFAEEAGLTKSQAKKRIVGLAKSLPFKARQLQADPFKGFVQREVVERIILLIEQRCALTVRRLTAATTSNESAF